MFETHKLNEAGFEEVAKLKETKATETALSLMPEGREKSVFKTHIETAMFFGTKAVSSKTENWAENGTEIIRYNGNPPSPVSPRV